MQVKGGLGVKLEIYVRVMDDEVVLGRVGGWGFNVILWSLTMASSSLPIKLSCMFILSYISRLRTGLG